VTENSTYKGMSVLH